MRKGSWLWAAVVALTASVAGSAAWATSVRWVNLAEMTETADRVFRGRCLAVRNLNDNPSKLPTVEFRFEVLEAVKGVQKGQTVVFRQVRTRIGRGPGIPGVPTYGKGDEVVLFLAGDSRIGLTSPIGLGQGVFRMVEAPGGEARVVNELDNRNLALGMERVQASAMGLTANELTSLRRSGPISIDTLLRATRKIEGHQSRTRRER